MAYFSIEKVQVAWGPLGQRKQVPSQSQSKGHSSQQNSNCSFTNSSATIPQTSGTLLFQSQMCPSGSFWSKIFLMHIKNIKPGSQRWRLITRHLYKESNTFNMCLISPLFQHSYRLEIITHAVAGIQFFSIVFLHNISKTDGDRITKRDTDMSHGDSCKPIYFGVKRTKVKVTSHKNIVCVGLLCTGASCF